MLEIVGAIAALVAAGGLLFWSAVGLRLLRTSSRGAGVRRGLDLPAPTGGWPRLSIVVPAHDEERVVDACLRSLRALDYPDLEIIFVLDRCRDGTLGIVRRHAGEDPRVAYLENDACPPEWAGKCHAARLGAERATGDLLLFTDADVRVDPGLARAAVAILEERGVGLLSLLSTLTATHGFEVVAQPVASFSLIALYPIERVDRGLERSRPFANGQFMLFRRDVYDRLGGHEAVRDDLLEDIAFARAVDHLGERCAVLIAEGMLVCSMYDSLAAFRTGWKRIFIEACKRKPARLRKHALRLLAQGPLLTLARLVAVACGAAILATGSGAALGMLLVAAAVLSGLVQGVVLAGFHRACGAPLRGVPLHVVGCVVVAAAMLEGASDLVHRRPVRWAGREYVLEPR